jgi:hypothetical protein
MSESKKELYASLVKAQSSLKNPKFDKVNTFLKTSYATLASVREAITAPLAENGLGVIQNLSLEDGKVCCTTKIVHESGQFEESRFAMPVGEKATPQQYGIVSTYLRRYSLMAMLNIVGDDDTDAEDRSHPEQSVDADTLREKLGNEIRRVGAAVSTTALKPWLEKLGLEKIGDIKLVSDLEALKGMLALMISTEKK